MAELLSQLAKDGPAQVLTVSHAAAFQAVCNAAVHVRPPTAERAVGAATKPTKRARVRFAA